MAVVTVRLARLAVVALLLVAAGCGTSKSAQQTVTVTVASPATTTTSPKPSRPATPPAVQASLATFTGTHASISYPASFAIVASEAPKGSYVDTTIESAANPAILIRLDVLPTADTTPDPNAELVRASLTRQARYRELQFTHTAFDGYADAIRWQFLVEEHGVLLHKIDTFFIDNGGDEVAILTQAPASVYARWAPIFRRIQNSFRETGTPVVPPPPTAAAPAPPSSTAFCDTHSCIPNFDNGNGYIVQCADGEWSHSGGLPGACSYHGGETSTVYPP